MPKLRAWISFFFTSNQTSHPLLNTKPKLHSQMTSIIATATATPTQPPLNHGRKWTPEEDLNITDTPDLGDEHFAVALGRSTHAVQSRRALLAARLHAASGRPIAECAEQFHASVAKTSLIAAGGEGEERMKKKKGEKHDETDRVRIERKKVSVVMDRYNQINAIKPRPASAFSTRTRAATAPIGVATIAAKQASPINIVCSFIKRHAGGDMNELWTQEALVPTLVQYHAGFQAYAAFVRGREMR